MFILVAAFLASVARSAAQPGIRWCSALPVAEWELSRIRDVVDARGADAELSRRMYDVPLTSRDSVIRVTDERVCERAARTYYRHELGPIPSGGVTVIRIANRYIVSGARRAGEWTIMMIYSLDFDTVSSVAG